MYYELFVDVLKLRRIIQPPPKTSCFYTDAGAKLECLLSNNSRSW
jgi:hypothetical protein